MFKVILVSAFAVPTAGFPVTALAATTANSSTTLTALATPPAAATSDGVIAVSLRRHRRLLEPIQDGYSFQRGMQLYASEYCGEIAVGTPSKLFNVVLDSGSGNLLLPSVACEDAACVKHRRYDAALSHTAVDLFSAETPIRPGSVASGDTRPRETVTITYGTGEMTGVFQQDDVCIGGLAASGQLCTELSFIASTNASTEPFLHVPFDGILGLGLPQLTEARGFSFVDSMIMAGKLKRNLFSVFFAQDSSDTSEILFGDYREELISEPLLWVPVANPGYWQVAMPEVFLGEEPLGLCGHLGCQAAFDTGTSLIAGPSRMVRRLAEKLHVALDCSNFEKLPDLGFSIGGKTYWLAPVDYVDKNPEGCILSLMALDIPPPRGPVFILGDVFLRKYYTVYDREHLRVGVARARGADTLASPSAPVTV